MILYILQKGYHTKTAKGVDELNALVLEGYKFVRAEDKEEPEVGMFVCEKCGKQYKTKRSYLKHINNCEG